MDTLQSTSRRAPFLSAVFALKVFHRVLGEWGAWISTLLRAPVDQPVLADVEVPGPGAATPFVRFTFSDVVLKPVEPRVILVAELFDLLKDVALVFAEWFQCAVVIVNHAHSGGK